MRLFSFFNKFWQWYEKHYLINISFAAFLFLWQVFHLLWLFGEVIWFKIFHYHLFEFQGFWKLFIIFVDYTEIPALISVSLVYLNELRKGFKFSEVFYLFLIATQVLHIFWITDEYVVETLKLTPERTTILPGLLAWLAILIDYAEVPVMVDTIKKLKQAFEKRKFSSKTE